MNKVTWNLPWILGDPHLEAPEVLVSPVALLVPKHQSKRVTPALRNVSQRDGRSRLVSLVGATENSLVSPVLPDPPVQEDPLGLGSPAHPGSER